MIATAPLARVVAVSDLHYAHAKFPFYNDTLGKLNAAQPTADVLYFGGDASEPVTLDGEQKSVREGIKRVLGSLSESGTYATKLWTLGNNDLEDGRKYSDPQGRKALLTEHYQEYGDLAREFGFHLLDETPFVDPATGLAFAGNIGESDGSFFVPLPDEIYAALDAETRKKAPANDTETLMKIVDVMFERDYAPMPLGLTRGAFFLHTFERLNEQLLALERDPVVRAIIMVTHMAPLRSGIKYYGDPGAKPHFNVYNIGMGSDKLSEHYRHGKVIGGFFGHTHRSEIHEVGAKPVWNVSGEGQPHFFEVTESDGKTEIKKVDDFNS